MGGYIHSIRTQLQVYRFIDPNDFIWKEYLQSELPILIIPGDHFIFNLFCKEYNRQFRIRDMTINSLEDL